MTARANWFVQEMGEEVDANDPFAMPIEEVGERVDLRDPAARLDLRLRELVHREAGLFNGGTTCPIKDRPDTTCHACPVAQHDPDVPLSVLCRIGREQEVVLTERAVLECHDR